MLQRIFGSIFVILICAFGFSVLVSCSYRGVRGVASEAYSEVNLKSLSFPENAEDLSFEDLKSILERHQFSRIEDLLKYLSQNKPKYLSRHTLGYASKSLHESSFENPRAIVFGSSAHFVISFNGSEKQRAYEMLEVMNFNKVTKQFEFYEIEFNEKNSMTKPYKISENGGQQGKCLGCHAEFKPIWSQYDTWPGFYGSSDDYPVTMENKNAGESAFFGLKVPEAVLNQWLGFEKSMPKHSRYQYLGKMAPSLLTGKDRRPNADLNTVLFFRNLERIEQLLVNSGSRDERRYLILYGAYCYESNIHHPLYETIQKFEQKAQVQQRAFMKYQTREHARELGLDWKEIEAQSLRDPDNSELESKTAEEFFRKLSASEKFSLGSVVQFPGVFAVIDKYFPIRTETLPMAFPLGVYRFDFGGPTNIYFKKMLLRATLGETPAVDELSIIGNCQSLGEKALKVIEDL